MVVGNSQIHHFSERMTFYQSALTLSFQSVLRDEPFK